MSSIGAKLSLLLAEVSGYTRGGGRPGMAGRSLASLQRPSGTPSGWQVAQDPIRIRGTRNLLGAHSVCPGEHSNRTSKEVREGVSEWHVKGIRVAWFRMV